MALEDVQRVMEIERQSFSAPWSARAYRYEIAENSNSTMVVVRPAYGPEGGLELLARQLGFARPRPVLGYGGFWLLVDDAHIATIAVDPEWRGRGLGELLLLAMLERGDGQGAMRATLEVRVSNEVAQGLYYKYAFGIVSRRKRYYADNNEDAYIMATPPFADPAYQAILRRNRDALYARQRAQRGSASGGPRSP